MTESTPKSSIFIVQTLNPIEGFMFPLYSIRETFAEIYLHTNSCIIKYPFLFPITITFDKPPKNISNVFQY